MNKSGRKVNPDFFNQQHDEVQVFIGKRPSTSSGLATPTIPRQSTRSSMISINTEAQQKPQQSSRILPNMTPSSSTTTSQPSRIIRKEPIPLRAQHEEKESLYEMTKYLNKQNDDSFNDDSFNMEDQRFFKPVGTHTLRMDDLDESTDHRSRTPETLEESDNEQTPNSIYESPIQKPLPSHRRSLSARMLPNMGRGFINPRKHESEEDSPNKESFAEVSHKRKPARYPTNLLKKGEYEVSEDEKEYEIQRPYSSHSNSNIEKRRMQEEINKLTGEINQLKREKIDHTKSQNDKVRSMQVRFNEDIQNQQAGFEKLLEDKEKTILEIQRDNERLRDQLGVIDKSKDNQDTNKLLNELENKRKLVNQFENEKFTLTDQIEKLKYDLSELNSKLKEAELKIRNKEETIHGLSNKIESQDREIKILKEREYKETNERERALAMFTESDKSNLQLQDKLKNLEFQSKQIQRESEVLSQRYNTLDTTRVQLEKINDQLRAKLETLDEELHQYAQEKSSLHQEREQFLRSQQRAQQEIESYTREISNLREIINKLKNDKLNSHTSSVMDTSQYNTSIIENKNFQPNNHYNRKNTNLSLSSSTQGLMGGQSDPTSFNAYTTLNFTPSRDNTYEQLSSYRDKLHSTTASSLGIDNSSRYSQSRYNNTSNEGVEIPKQSTTTNKVLSIINSKESPKERQHNRNKIMGTSYSLTPFALDESVAGSQTANIDEQLMQLSMEKTRLEGDMQKLFSMGIKSIAAKKQKMTVESRLEEIEKQSSQLKMRLRSMNY